MDIIAKLKDYDVPMVREEMAATITPEIAAELLKVNTNNRTINQAAVKQYTAAMERGEWVYNGRTIVISKDGVLRDGQHMLLAVIASGVTIKALIAIEVDHEAQTTMDSGRKRTLGDILYLQGEKNSSDLAAAIRNLYAYEHVGVPSTERLIVQPTNAQAFDVLDRHPGLRESVNWLNKKGTRPWFVVPSRAATIFYIFSTYNDEDAFEFFAKLASGEGLEDSNPILVLRERLIKDKMEPGKRLRTDAASAFMIKSWNSWRRGDPIRRLQLKLGGASPEQFPIIEIMDGDNPNPVLPGRRASAVPVPKQVKRALEQG